MPDNGFQIVIFTHQDVGVWDDLAEILWASGLQVAARCESAPERMTERQRPRYERLARLLRAQRVEIRVLPDASFGLIHGKAGVIRYRARGSTCFLGSINETGEAWTLHYELLWEDEDPGIGRLGSRGV